MNFDRKLTKVYLDFEKSLEKKNKDKKVEPEATKGKEKGKTMQELDDQMFEVPQAVNKIKEGLAPEVIKHFQKTAKTWVRENISDGGCNKVDVEATEGTTATKRKMSPRSV